MQETLQQYRDRTTFMQDSLPEHNGLCTSAGAALKVDEQEHFRPFFGDTVIFSLPQPMIARLADIQAALYDQCGGCLADPLRPETFHITLHDLLSHPSQMPEGAPERERLAHFALQEIRASHPPLLHVRSVCVFSMVGTSLVMGFEPCEEQDCAALMSMHELFQQIVPLAYPLTLHVTLAYYRPGVYGEDMLRRLRQAVQVLGREVFEGTLSLAELRYATFKSMANYHLR